MIRQATADGQQQPTHHYGHGAKETIHEEALSPDGEHRPTGQAEFDANHDGHVRPGGTVQESHDGVREREQHHPEALSAQVFAAQQVDDTGIDLSTLWVEMAEPGQDPGEDPGSATSDQRPARTPPPTPVEVGPKSNHLAPESFEHPICDRLGGGSDQGGPKDQYHWGQEHLDRQAVLGGQSHQTLNLLLKVASGGDRSSEYDRLRPFTQTRVDWWKISLCPGQTL